MNPPDNAPQAQLEGISSGLAEASVALESFASGPAQRAANELSAAFERAGERIARALVRASGEGEAGFRQLARTVLETFAEIALERLRLGRQSFVSADSGKSAAQNVAVHFHMAGAEPSGVMRSKAQIAAGIARAVALGHKNL